MKSLKAHMSGAPEDVSHWEHQEGTQYGSNEGGIHHDEQGVAHYVKIAKNPEQARQEVASAKIHELLGVKTLKPKLISKNGKIGTATKWNDSLEVKRPSHFEKINDKQAGSIMRIHHAGVITKNWDAVGLEHDNIAFHKNTGEPHAIDQGGSFEFRAQGGHKAYTSDIAEISSFRNPEMNHASAHVFNHIDKKFPQAAKNALTHAKKLTYNDIHAALSSSGVSDAKNKAKTVIARRDKLVKYYSGE